MGKRKKANSPSIVTMRKTPKTADLFFIHIQILTNTIIIYKCTEIKKVTIHYWTKWNDDEEKEIKRKEMEIISILIQIQSIYQKLKWRQNHNQFIMKRLKRLSFVLTSLCVPLYLFNYLILFLFFTASRNYAQALTSAHERRRTGQDRRESKIFGMVWHWIPSAA